MTLWRWVEFIGVWALILILPVFYVLNLFRVELWSWALPVYSFTAGVTIIADLRRRSWCRSATFHDPS